MNQIPTKKQYIPTNHFAARFGVQPDTVRRNLCVNGHFLGIKPVKLPNGRLLWPDVFPDDIAAARGKPPCPPNRNGFSPERLPSTRKKPLQKNTRSIAPIESPISPSDSCTEDGSRLSLESFRRYRNEPHSGT